ncbi:unnamed protein product [Didymodactylos carnosus]|uniref:Protein kinase domain-containing protein n=1 Tax=Didymodactylos carnosus TaxID=1234261 RepID=A0A815HF60_9BILA|nr:unnamed protein product [Didymodactylos carnosus]CAF1353301.1 unnamed protein product [Didymodactylos carnosus]CAF3653896.1 unnamed protein product [Didymodactylos carnosus]CAF4225177.1 unnamed protein product [Didymodactylos carnosus]
MKSINHRSRSSSVSSNGSINNNNNYGYSSSDSFLSLIESPVSSSSKNQSNQQQNQTYFRNRKRTHDRVNIVANGTIIKDSNNNNWMVQNCIKARHERYLYTVTPVKHQSAQQQQQQHNIVKTKISPLMFLTEKLKESREDILNKAKAQNEELDYVFYGAVMTTSDDNNNNNTNEHSVTNSTTANQLTWSSSCTLSLSSADSVEKKNKQLFSKFNGSEITPQHQKPKQVYEHNHHHQCEKVTKVIHGIVEFLKNDETYDSNKVNKYSVEMVFTQDKSQQNDNPSDLLQQVLKKEIFKLKEIRRKNTSNSNGDGFYKFIVKKDRLNDRNTYELHEQDEEQQTETNSKVIPTPIQPPIKYLLKLELSSANKTSTSSLYTIDNEINFYSKFATQDKLKSFIKKHQLMYLAIPEYVASGLYKHTNGSIYKFLIMEQYRDNLKSLINSYDSSLPEHNALNLFLQVLYVLQYIHEKNYVHKIIKPKYLTFASKQPYFIYLTQFRTVKYINDDTINGEFIY